MASRVVYTFDTIRNEICEGFCQCEPTCGHGNNNNTRLLPCEVICASVNNDIGLLQYDLTCACGNNVTGLFLPSLDLCHIIFQLTNGICLVGTGNCEGAPCP